APHEFSHGMPSSVPLIEIANYRYTVGVWCPDMERCPGNAIDFGQVSAELLVQLPMLALAEEMKIEGTEDCVEGIRIALDPDVPVVGGELEFVREAVSYALERGLKEAISLNPLCRPGLSWILEAANGYRSGVRTEYAHHQLLTGLVHAKYGERITVPRFENRVEGA